MFRLQTQRLRSRVARVGAWQNLQKKPVPDSSFCSSLPHTLRSSFSQTHPADPNDELRARPQLWKPVGLENIGCGPAGRIEAGSLCKQDIRLCQRDQKRLEVFLHSLSLPPSPLSLYLILAVSRRLVYGKQEGMAAGETQLYAKVSNKLKGRSPSSLLDPLLALGFPTHTA